MNKPSFCAPRLGKLGRVLGAAAVILLATGFCHAQWMQWGGPHRNFTVDGSGLADHWPDDGPPKLWSRELGHGHSAIVVDGDVLYTMVRRDEQDAVVALKAATGETIWETRYDAPPKPDMQLEFGCGPHATPLVVDGRVFTVGATALFNCLDAKTGKILWSHDLMKEFGTSHLGRGFAASPIAYKDMVIINSAGPGGAGNGFVAFRQKDGEIAWKSPPLPGGAASPVIVTIHGEPHLLAALGPKRVGLNPDTGEIRWEFAADVQSAAIMSTPLFISPDRIFFSCAYGGGSAVVKVSKTEPGYKAEQVWHNTKMKVQHGTFVRQGDSVYGSSGDFGPAFLMGISLESGDVLWRERGLAKANVLLAGDKLIILDEEGNLFLASATPSKLEVLSKAKLLEEKSWTVPTLVGTRLYLRDHHRIMALDLGAAPKG